MTEGQVQEARRRVHRIREFYVHAAIFAVFIGGLTLFNWIVSPTFWWVVFPAIGWGIGLAAHAVSVFFEDAILDKAWEERKTRELIEQERRGTG
jgi:two-component system, LytTR family, sensor kinase